MSYPDGAAGPERRNLVAVLLVSSAVVMAGTLVAMRNHFQPPKVPRYEAAGNLQAGVSDAEPGQEKSLRGDGQFEMELRPESPVAGAVGARAFLLRRDEVRAWDPPYSVAVDGIVRISGTVEALFAGIPRGRWEVAVAVGRPEVLPTSPRDILRRRDEDPTFAGWHLVRVPVRLEE
jgi:hypothetical protein